MHDVIRKEAWPFYRTISGVRLCWELEEPKGPKGDRTLSRGRTPPPAQRVTKGCLSHFEPPFRYSIRGNPPMFLRYCLP